MIKYFKEKLVRIIREEIYRMQLEDLETNQHLMPDDVRKHTLRILIKVAKGEVAL
jgi:hypothetical protein